MNTYDLRGLLAEVWATPGVSTITYSVLLNVVLAWAVAIKTRTFTLDRVADFLTSQLIPYVSVYAGAQFLGEGAGYGWLGNVAYVLVLAKMGASILDKLKQLGVPIPNSVMPYVAEQKDVLLEKHLGVISPSKQALRWGEIAANAYNEEVAKQNARDIFAPSEGPSEIRSTGGDTGAKG